MINWMEGKEWKSNRHANFPEINGLLWEWFQEEKGQNEPITRAVVKKRALEIASELGYGKFCASDSWFGRWVKQYDVKLDHEAKKITPHRRNSVSRRTSRDNKVLGFSAVSAV